MPNPIVLHNVRSRRRQTRGSLRCQVRSPSSAAWSVLRSRASHVSPRTARIRPASTMDRPPPRSRGRERGDQAGFEVDDYEGAVWTLDEVPDRSGLPRIDLPGRQANLVEAVGDVEEERMCLRRLTDATYRGDMRRYLPYDIGDHVEVRSRLSKFALADALGGIRRSVGQFH